LAGLDGVSVPPPRVLGDGTSDAIDDDFVTPFVGGRFTPLHTFVHGPLKLVVGVAERAGAAAGGISETPVLIARGTETCVEVERGGGKQE